jgi:hypothetical protein
MQRRLSSIFDKAAIGLSSLCLVHCLVGSLILAVFATTGGWLGHDVHVVGLALAMPLAVFALWRGVRSHGRYAVAALGACGLVLMAASLSLVHGGSEILVSMAGVILLGAAHYWNIRAGRA